MNAKDAIKEMEIAIWELAEAATLERKAAKLRLESTKRIASVHSFFKDALKKMPISNNRQKKIDRFRDKA